MATTQTTELQLFKPEIGGEEDTWGQLLNTNMDEIDAHAASVNTTLGTLGTAATEADTKYAHRANNLSDLQSASAARTSLGLGTAATEADTKYNHRANNLSDVANQSTARNNLGLGTAAVQNDTRYNHRSNNLSDVANTTTARVNLGAHNASNLTTGTVNAARLPSTVPFTQDDVVSMGGDWGTNQCRIQRVGKTVTITMVGTTSSGRISFTASRPVQTSNTIIPTWARPSDTGGLWFSTREHMYWVQTSGAITAYRQDGASFDSGHATSFIFVVA